jgi:hypothetical protein
MVMHRRRYESRAVTVGMPVIHYHAGDFHPLLFAGFYRRFRLDPFMENHATDIRLSTLEKFAKAVGPKIHVALM